MHIQTVGLKGIKTPVRVKEKSGELQNTIATISMQAELEDGHKNNCVETFTSILNQSLGEISVESFSNILARVKEKLCAKSVRLEMSFPYFIN